MPKKILIIDDNPELVKAVEIRLKASGYDVGVAYDGLDGIKKAKEVKPDLILLDIILPGMHGFEVCKRLKENQETKEIPVVIFTAAGVEDIARDEPEIQAEAYIAKPFETNDLLKIVNATLKKE